MNDNKKNKLEILSEALIRKQNIIKRSAASTLAGPEVTLAKLLVAEQPQQKEVQKVK